MPNNKAFIIFVKHYDWLHRVVIIINLMISLFFAIALASRHSGSVHNFYIPLAFLWTALLAIKLRIGFIFIFRQISCRKFKVCLHCGYSLYGLPVLSICPECGHYYEIHNTQRVWIHKGRKTLYSRW